MSWFSPYVLVDGQVDTRSFDTVLADKRFACKQGEELAIALWRWLVDPKEGFYHFLAGTEEPGETLIADPVKDPLRLLNTYGYGLCGNVAMLFAALYDWAGGRSRVVGIPGHSISEAYWDGAWHLIDCDLRALHYKKTERGHEIAGLHELVNDPAMVACPARKSDPYYMSDEHARDVARDCYKSGQDRYLPRYFYRLGSMDYILRPWRVADLLLPAAGPVLLGQGLGPVDPGRAAPGLHRALRQEGPHPPLRRRLHPLEARPARRPRRGRHFGWRVRTGPGRPDR
jgi:hypothetical protein